MDEGKRRLILILIMIVSSMIIAGSTIFILYTTALEEERTRLAETAQSQARLMEAVARFNESQSKGYSKGPAEATLSQIIEAHKNYQGFGTTGEFTLARREGDHIVFILRHRHSDLDIPKPVPFDSELAEPMRLALSGKSGTVVGLDYRGKTVLAAYEPVRVLDLGLVAKIDLAEIRSPFVKASAIAASITLIIVIAGAALFLRLINPLIRHLEENEEK